MASFLESNSKPVISLHLWHLDVAIDILKTYKKTSKYFELRLAIPDNLTPSILNQLNNHLEQKYHFSKVTTLKISAVGRDIGGLISSLIYSMESFEYRGRPHLFLHEKGASKMKKALKSELGVFAPNAVPSVILEPSNGSLHSPAPTVTSQWSAVFGLDSPYALASYFTNKTPAKGIK